MEDKDEELELQLDGSFTDLKHSESENALLKSQVDLANERFEKMRQHCRELELNQKALKDQILKSEKKYKEQLESFEEALRDKELMNMELLDVRHSSSRLTAELESSRKSIKDLQERIKEKENLEVGFNNQELQIISLEQDLSNLTYEKINLQNTVIDLRRRLSLNEEMYNQLKSVYGQLEHKLNMTEENFNRADSMLSEALSYKEELEQKLELLEMATDDSTMVKVVEQRNVELEELVKKLIDAETDAKKQLIDYETKLASAEKKNQVLEQNLILSESKALDAEKEIKDLKDEVKELNNMLEQVEEEATELLRNSQGYVDKIGRLESNLSKSFRRNTELEKTLDELVGQVEEHEGRATETQQRRLELENLVQSSNSKAGDAVKRVSELELLLEASNYRTYELEQQLSLAEAKVRDAALESQQNCNTVVELRKELEAYKIKSTNLETALQAAKDKEMDLTEMLNIANEERKKLQEFSAIQRKNLSESENLILILQSELESLRENLESVEKDLEFSRVRENLLLEKFRGTEEQLKHNGKALEDVTTKNMAPISAYRHAVEHSEGEQKEPEANELPAQLNYHGEKVAIFEGQGADDAEKVEALKVQMNASATKIVSLERINAELKDKLSEASTNMQRINSENEVLVRTNTKLREELNTREIKVAELNELLKSTHIDKGEFVEQIGSNIMAESTLYEQSRSLDYQSATESCLKETEIQLHEAVEKLQQRDSEAAELCNQQSLLEAQVKISEEQSNSSARDAAERNSQLKEALIKLEDQKRFIEELQRKSDQFETKNEYLIKERHSLSQELEKSKTDMADLHASFKAVIAEKEILSLQISSSRKEMDDLVKQLDYNKEILQSQIDILGEAVAEKDALLTAKREEQTSVVQEKDNLHEKLKEMQNELALAHVRMNEQKNLDSKKELERQASTRQSLGELESKSLHATKLEKQVEELKLRLMETEKQYQDKVMESEKFAVLNDELNEMKHNLRQTVEMEKTMASLHNQFQFQLHKVQKEEYKGMSSSTLKAAEMIYVEPGVHLAVEPSAAMAFKFLMGVALLSVIFGIVLGKRY